MKFYSSSSVDYITVPVNCGDLKATDQTFQSCQPSVLGLNKKKRILLCKHYKHGKPYKKAFIKPPALLLNKWYFQKELANFPLLMLLTSAASLDRYYLPSTSISETIGFKSLNTQFFQLHGFKTPTTSAYTPNSDFALFAIDSKTTTFEDATAQQLILLGNPRDFQHGEPLGNTKTNWNTYLSTPRKWGNPFIPYWLGQDIEDGALCLLNIKNKTIAQALEQIQPSDKISQKGFIKPSKPLLLECRYNPQPDMGHNAVFLAKITNDYTPWHEPDDNNIIQQGYPLWLIWWGWHDYLIKAKVAQNIDTDYINVIVSDYITHSPKQPGLTYIVPVDGFFLSGRSPYAAEGEIKGYDLLNWHPKGNFQMQTISHILQTGPGTCKLPPKISAEAHVYYKFHFKVGGCPPSMDEVCNPRTQPTYPQPGNLLSSILLQNPEYPIQYYISNFDQRREMLTSRAAKRLKEDQTFKESVFKPTGKTLMEVKAYSPQASSSETSEEEESEETLQGQLNIHKRRQRKLQHRILQLLSRLETTL